MRKPSKNDEISQKMPEKQASMAPKKLSKNRARFLISPEKKAFLFVELCDCGVLLQLVEFLSKMK
jgi:hypothetical protein